jgi:hypothetical protein
MDINSQHHNLIGSQISSLTQNRLSLKVVHLVFKIFKMAAISKWSSI